MRSRPERKPHIRIIAGQWRSRRLVVPQTPRTRPMPDRLRGSIFDILGSRYEEPGRLPPLAVADLFAGSGSMGLEALSRGVSHCDFVERDREAVAALRDNVKTLGAFDRCDIRASDAWTAPLTTPRPRAPYGLIVVDPPYADSRDTSRGGRVGLLLADLTRCGWVDGQTILVLHHEARVAWTQSAAAAWTVVDHRVYGSAAVTFVAFTPPAEPSAGAGATLQPPPFADWATDGHLDDAPPDASHEEDADSPTSW